mmetsp:Transcript_2734/g.2892  ORF Transcript_2734/g.2892 Transcript_2734/m.2892 type:complete len:254 (+) Transcript_2734:46-807(+)
MIISSRRMFLPLAFLSCTAAFRKNAISHCGGKVLEATSIADLRKEYSSKGLSEDGTPDNPIELFKLWFDEARKSEVLEPNAMCLSTCTENKPSARIVLLKDFDTSGFVWYTNYESRKAKELEINPNAALTFWWADLERSVRVEGVVIKVTDEESDAYFNSRPRDSQIGAWSSNQSSLITNRDTLQAQETEVRARFNDLTVPVPRPSHWGGFRLRPHRVEFWKGRQGRLHDRLIYNLQEQTDQEESWSRGRLQP